MHTSINAPFKKQFKFEAMQLVLSLFSGIDLFGRGFEENGFCVVSAGDTILGQDIRQKKFVSGKFDGIIGGSPCQDFSKARRTPPTGYGLEMLAQFKRVVEETQPNWFVLENVPQVPDMAIAGYTVQRFNLNASECGSLQNRNRCFQFGSSNGLIISVHRNPSIGTKLPCVTASEGGRAERRGFEDFCELQGLPRDFELAEFHLAAKYRAVGNAVNLLVAKRVALAVLESTENRNPIPFRDAKFCACGCGRLVEGRAHKQTANATCRKRFQLLLCKNELL
jgi:DNA (cytosine-5)-methyltransferase 1